MLAPVPVVHRVEHGVRLVDGEHRPFGQRVQMLVRDDGGDLDDVIAVGLQSRHLQVDPDQAQRISVAHCGIIPADAKVPRTCTIHWFAGLFVLLLIAATLTRSWLNQRQVAAVLRHRDEVPEAFRAQIDLASHQKAADYTVASAQIGRWDKLLDAAAGAPADARRRAQR